MLLFDEIILVKAKIVIEHFKIVVENQKRIK